MIDLFFYTKLKSIVKSKEWTTETVNNLMYDANIDLNFLNSPGLKTERERECDGDGYSRAYSGNILVGYLFELKQDHIHNQYYYVKPKNFLKLRITEIHFMFILKALLFRKR